MAGRGLLPLLRLLLFVIALEASSSPSSYTSTHRRSLSSWSTSLHSRVNGSTIRKYKMKRELSDGSDSQDSLVDESDDNPEPTVTPCKDGDSGLPRFKNPPIVRSITANSAMVGLTPWTTQYYIGEMPDGSQPSFVLQFWEDGSRKLAQEYKIFARTQQGNTHTFSGLTPDTMYTFSGIKANTMYTFSGLTPNTSYHVQALVKVTVGGKTCTADGEEVKAMNFTTFCPDPPKPVGLSATRRYDTSIAVQWSAGSYPRQCVLQYRLRVEKKRGYNRFIKDHVTEEVHDYITDLQPYTDYLVMVQSKSGRKYSAITSTTVKTLPSRKRAAKGPPKRGNKTCPQALLRQIV